jgi:poly(3-hydroxybutyrate) depolymerase
VFQDSAYIRALIEAVQGSYPVDPRAIFVGGHSNGGFMSYRLACDHSDLIAGIASIAGAAFNPYVPPNHAWLPGVGGGYVSYSCNPTHPINVLQIHGDADETVSFAGENFKPNLTVLAVCVYDHTVWSSGQLHRRDLHRAVPVRGRQRAGVRRLQRLQRR